MDIKQVNIKHFIALVSAFLLIALSIYALDINVWGIPSQLIAPNKRVNSSVLGVKTLRSRGFRNKSVAGFAYAEREAFYHNTVDVDYLHREDFQKEPPPDSKLSSATGILRAKFIRAERLYAAEVVKRTKFLAIRPREKIRDALELLNIFKASFNCPFLAEDVGEVGNEEWVCGFELYRTDPKPQECVVYTFGTPPAIKYERKWLTKTDCKIFKFQFNGNELSKNIPNPKQLETFPASKIGTIDIGNRMQTLRTIMKQNDHGWLDVLVLNVNGEIYDLLKHFIRDFEVQVLPFAQLIVKFPVADHKKFMEMFTTLESQGLRPFHVSRGRDHQDLQYSFLNLRGKHLLLVGEE